VNKKILCSGLLLLVMTPLVLSHPHFSKTVTATLPGNVEATITYNTTPANEIHATNAAEGKFVTPRGPRLKLSADVTAGSVKIAAGEYVVGVIKNSDKDWAMALYAGTLRRGDTPDPSKVIKLDSLYSASEGTAHHMLLDITPGSGKFEGKAVLTLHFGSMFLAGALS
jgi:hypothetical protein